jgi:ATP-dependent 26S proteasome regulatory subunit
VAATNHARLLDRALFRRFDTVIEYALPAPEAARKVMAARLSLLDTSNVDWASVLAATEGLSHGELARACEHAAKDAILANRLHVSTQDLLHALAERRTAQG